MQMKQHVEKMVGDPVPPLPDIWKLTQKREISIGRGAVEPTLSGAWTNEASGREVALSSNRKSAIAPANRPEEHTPAAASAAHS